MIGQQSLTIRPCWQTSIAVKRRLWGNGIDGLRNNCTQPDLTLARSILAMPPRERFSRQFLKEAGIGGGKTTLVREMPSLRESPDRSLRDVSAQQVLSYLVQANNSI